MNRQEKKTHLAEVTRKLLMQNKDKEEIIEALKEEGGNAYEVTEIYGKIYRELRREYQESIDKLLKIGFPEDKIVEVLHAEQKYPPEPKLREMIKDVRKKIINQKLGQLNPYIQNGAPLEKIIEAAEDSFTTREMITEHYHKVVEQAKSAKSAESNNNVMVGLGCIIGGLVATGISFSVAAPGQSYIAFTGLIIYGFITLVK